jgi:hypothetical protein
MIRSRLKINIQCKKTLSSSAARGRTPEALGVSYARSSSRAIAEIGAGQAQRRDL